MGPLTFNMAAPRFAGVVRRFSTSATRERLVQAPIQLFGLEGRYAHALYSAATKEKKLDAVEKDLAAFKNVLSTDTKFSSFLADPSIKRKDKATAMEAASKKQNYTPVTSNFLTAMAENGRLGKVGSIIGAFETIMAAHRGDVVCTVTTAKPLERNQMKDLEASLKLFLKKGENLQLSVEVDPALVGGMTVNIGDKFVDMSIAAKIKKYSTLIKQAV